MAIRPVDFIISTVTKFFVAHAASPRPDRWKDWIKYEGVKMFYIKPTTIEELQLGIQFQDHGDRPTADQVRRFFSRWGPSARDAYLNATDPSDYEVDPTGKVRAINFKSACRTLAYKAGLSIAPEVHVVLLLQPDLNSRSCYIMSIASRAAMEKLRQHKNTKWQVFVLEFYPSFLHRTTMRPKVAWMLGAQAHNII